MLEVMHHLYRLHALDFVGIAGDSVLGRGGAEIECCGIPQALQGLCRKPQIISSGITSVYRIVSNTANWLTAKAKSTFSVGQKFQIAKAFRIHVHMSLSPAEDEAGLLSP